jgi:hypothetical protein
MPADAVIAILGTTLLVTGAILARLPVGHCSECPHCAATQLARDRALEASAGRMYGIPQCPACGRYHTRDEPHRR